MATSNAYSTPVGTVLLWAGSTDSANILNLMMAGWLVCDGSSYLNTDYPDLYNVIGESYGGSAGYFAVPCYKGLFLRGVTGQSANDPDADSRTAPRPDLANGGNRGNNVGSVQPDAIGSHAHNYNVYNNYLKSSHTLGHCCLSGTAASNMQTVGGDETRPINQYIHFIIKYIQSPDIVPVGAVLPYAGSLNNPLPAGWLPCTGNKQTASSYPNLYKVISSFYGADDLSSFYLPDFRGRFLRGVQGPTIDGLPVMDTDNAARTAPRPSSAYTGNAGNLVGSLQDTLFGSHTHGYQAGGSSNWQCAATAIGPHAEACNGQTWTSGGNSELSESRPANINTNFIIKAE